MNKSRIQLDSSKSLSDVGLEPTHSHEYQSLNLTP
jgi:hypothetical protein